MTNFFVFNEQGALTALKKVTASSMAASPWLASAQSTQWNLTKLHTYYIS
jgi:hypothetical protein